MATSVISRPIGVTVEFITIAKIHKYKRFHERHHFIPMAMEMHDVLECDMDSFIKKCVHFFHN
jgi:hypothetical protein